MRWRVESVCWRDIGCVLTGKSGKLSNADNLIHKNTVSH
nr:MAG TPA: hypothetical protein [Caudoviricetes sp.]